jgi:lipoprotein-anchoring transpeptidase ErfK/SrfK
VPRTPATPVTRPTGRFRHVLVAAGIVAALVGGGCSGERPELAAETSTTTTAKGSTTSTEADPPVEVATANGDSIDVFPDATSDTPAQTITGADATSAPGIPIVFLVKGHDDDRIEVHLPVPPNGSTGWVQASDVSVATVPFRIEVGLTEHRLRVYEDDEVVVDEAVGVGTTDRPTPGGVHYLKELLQPPDPTGPYGTYAYPLSGFSTALESFSGGEGLVGIHGTDDPTSIGQDTPTGCIRLSNDAISHLVNEVGLPLGTPVEILA